MWDIGDKPEHDPLNNNNYIYIFRNIKTLNYVLFLFCVCLIYQSWMFVLLMMPHVGPMIRQYNVFYSILNTILYKILYASDLWWLFKEHKIILTTYGYGFSYQRDNTIHFPFVQNQLKWYIAYILHLILRISSILVKQKNQLRIYI